MFYSVDIYLRGRILNNLSCCQLLLLLLLILKIKDKTVTVDATGGDAKNPNNYALDGGNYSTGTVFSNVSYGNHVIHVKTPNNCICLAHQSK